MNAAEETLHNIDTAIDSWWESAFRGKPVMDRVMYSVSETANHSRLWHALGAAQAVAQRSHRPAVELSVSLLAEAVLVNGLIKTAFGRRRPDFTGDRPHLLRQPITSSFPSGHASAAMVAATLLSRRSRWAPAYWALALIVALSRIHVRIHHASDVAAGIGTGAALGAIARRLWR